MPVSTRFVAHQLPVIAQLGRTALAALAQRVAPATGAPALPGALTERVIDPPPNDLVRAYIKAVGGELRTYRGKVPAHLFSQWGLPMAAAGLSGVPYPIMKIVNGGCRMEVREHLPAGEPLEVTAQLVDIDDDGRRAVLHQVITTGRVGEPPGVVAHLYPIVVYGKRKEGAPRKERPVVPTDGVTELDVFEFVPSDALDFAKLTGDFNPIHWIEAYAKMSGFESTILHGFASMSWAIEGVQRKLYGGEPAVRVCDARFTSPLALPARVGLYVSEPGEDGAREVWLGDGPGERAYMTATMSE
jgi:acyl dehydratase